MGRHNEHHNVEDTPKDIEFPRTIVCRLTEDQWQFLRLFAESQGTTLSEIARQIVEASRQQKLLREKVASDGR